MKIAFLACCGISFILSFFTVDSEEGSNIEPTIIGIKATELMKTFMGISMIVLLMEMAFFFVKI
jgi:hypothetical protein